MSFSLQQEGGIAPAENNSTPVLMSLENICEAAPSNVGQCYVQCICIQAVTICNNIPTTPGVPVLQGIAHSHSRILASSKKLRVNCFDQAGVLAS
jgi:hypothetical protein